MASGAGTVLKAELREDLFDCIRRYTPWLNPGVTEGLFRAATLIGEAL
jgi:hypothetical protein